MDFNHLLYFQAVARTENVTKAAQALHVAQPSLSKTISKLEEELGAALFDRQANAIRLNDCGRAFLKRVERILLELQDARNELNELHAGEAGHIYFAATIPEMLNELVKTYMMEHPRVCIHQQQATAKQIHDLLLSGEIDFAISGVQIMDSGIQWDQLTAERVGILVSRENPLAACPVHRLDDLKSQRIIVNSNVDQQIFVRSFFEGEEAMQHIVFEGDQTEVIGHLISANRGIGFVSRRRYDALRRAEPSHETRTVFCDVEPPIYLITGICLLKDHYLSPAARQFYRYLVQNMQSSGI